MNSALQLKLADAASNTMRFAVNTLFGLGGVLDLARDAGIERHRRDFGTTLAHWGVPAGPYLVLPVLGPSTLRDTAALPLDWLGHPLARVGPVAERSALVAGQALDTRARLLPADTALDTALDPYLFLREAYLQHRSAQVAQVPQDGSGAEDAASVPTDDAAMAPQAGCLGVPHGDPTAPVC